LAQGALAKPLNLIDPARRTSHNPVIPAFDGPRAEILAERLAAASTASGLLPRFQLCGNQANLVDSRGTHDVNGASDFLKLDVVIALNESDLFRALLEDLLDARAEAFPSGIFVVDLDLPSLVTCTTTVLFSRSWFCC
jgi:hypothetical protein